MILMYIYYLVNRIEYMKLFSNFRRLQKKCLMRLFRLNETAQELLRKT